MIDYTLRFPSEAEAMLALFNDAGYVYPNTDVIGPIEGSTGYHVNVRSEEPIPELEPYAITVDTPIRVWA